MSDLIQAIRKFREILLAYKSLLDQAAYDQLLKSIDDLLADEIAKVNSK